MAHSHPGPDAFSKNDNWPALSFGEWKDTYATLHMWTQIVGKIRLMQAPWLNHSWQVTLYLTARGLTTGVMPYGARGFQVDFDFIDHNLVVQTGEGAVETMALQARPVADFHQELFSTLSRLGFDIKIHKTPNEVENAIPFDRDRQHASYVAEHANRAWRALAQAHRVFNQFRGSFIGKSSPVHFFWGSFDLAVTRFSGRTAPLHPGGAPNCPDRVMQEAYSHELASFGFWPGNEQFPRPVFYSYAYPAPQGFSAAKPCPQHATYDTSLGEFILPYDEVRMSAAPDAMLLDFLEGCYEAAASLGSWDREALERRS